MAKRPITDELLNLAVETKLDAGVPAERIRVLIDAFAGDEMETDRSAELVGFHDRDCRSGAARAASHQIRC